VVLRPLSSRNVPPPRYVAEALGLKRNAELQERWEAYLNETEDALAGAGIDEEHPEVKKFLNRLLGMPVSIQNRVFAHFSAELEEQIRRAKENHMYDEGVVDIRGQAVTIEAGYPARLASAGGVNIEHVKLGVDRGISIGNAHEMLLAKAEANAGGELYHGEGFYESRRPVFGRTDNIKSYVLLLQKPIPSWTLNPTPLFKVYRPATGLGIATYLAEHTPKFKAIDPDDAIEGWSRTYKEALTVCSHGPRCKHGSKCTVGKRVEYKHILTGSVLQFWDKIQQVVGFETRSDNGHARLVSRIRIVRVRAQRKNGDETRIVGVEATEKGVQMLVHLINGTAPEGKMHSAKAKMQSATPSVDVKPSVDIKPMGVSTSSSDSYSGSTLQPGKHVILHGLKKAAQFNHKRAIVGYRDPASGRWNVRIQPGQGLPLDTTVMAKASNLLCL